MRTTSTLAALLAAATLTLTPAAGAATTAHVRPCTAATISSNLWRLQEWWRRTDTGNHLITRREFDADAAITWTDFDLDGDGSWSGAEVSHARTQTDALLTRDASRPNYLCRTSDPSRVKLPAAAAGNPGFIRAVDANGDGTVTRAEYDASTATRFAGIDTNHDRVIRPLEAYRYGRQETPAQQLLIKQLAGS